MKVVLVGDSETGKTQWAKWLLTNKIETKYVPTLGVDNYTKYIGYHKLDIWDTAGDGKYEGLREGYCIGADIVIVFGNNYNKYINRCYKVATNAIIIKKENKSNKELLDTLFLQVINKN